VKNSYIKIDKNKKNIFILYLGVLYDRSKIQNDELGYSKNIPIG